MSQPPVERERRVMYTGFGLKELAPPGDERAKAIGDIGRVREAAYTTVSQAPGYVAPS
jgi:hypothetical protein